MSFLGLYVSKIRVGKGYIPHLGVVDAFLVGVQFRHLPYGYTYRGRLVGLRGPFVYLYSGMQASYRRNV